MRAREFQSDPTKQDLESVAEWLGTTVDQLEVTKSPEPIDRFLNQIKEMYASYDEFPEDADRTNRIVQLIKGGEKPLPIYVEADDPSLFVMEGRHRMVAFWLLGMKKIPVARVSKKQANLTETVQEFYHGSMNELPVGTVLTPRDDYENDWSNTSFYSALEHYRPNNMLAHKQSVFMCDNPDDIDLAGGGTEWVFTVIPQGLVQRHDLNWGSEISMLVDDGHSIDSPEIKRAAENYWAGVPHENESVWEYLTPAAKIIAVEPY